ncbi:glycosyltransferase [Alisedimentitalea sp. MJ-SS2]|uniref:glycosyltransferase family 2 protein n=1 Tax=Aliisedimentitalea sp. MJ-SS2 TaxID=3049795 RepID=UPI0029085454|nr:glycosyltransferase [Alisedimentitalea sp. MJ-SS2]MDU8930015.1 glycosyltransferase [Alisedimentitalea sp. MJ-SS2]
MSLALVIPVRDDQERLNRLLHQAAQSGVFDQVVICDDGSQDPVTIDREIGLGNRVTLLRHKQSQGPGIARNRALAKVRTTHMLYFDSDDCLTGELPLLWQDLQGEDFDFCLFRHHDSRNDRWGQMPIDNALWRRAGAGPASLFEPDRAALLALAQTANYPWNKIYRTGFLRDHKLQCAEVPLHEDIPLHWQSFLQAERVLASDRVAAVHFVQDSGQRMTNQSGAERLCVFEPLGTVAESLADSGNTGLTMAFFDFTSGLLDWVRAALDPLLRDVMDHRTGTFLKTHLAPGIFDRIARTDPVLALRLVLQMAGRRAPC